MQEEQKRQNWKTVRKERTKNGQRICLVVAVDQIPAVEVRLHIKEVEGGRESGGLMSEESWRASQSAAVDQQGTRQKKSEEQLKQEQEEERHQKKRKQQRRQQSQTRPEIKQKQQNDDEEEGQELPMKLKVMRRMNETLLLLLSIAPDGRQTNHQGSKGFPRPLLLLLFGTLQELVTMKEEKQKRQMVEEIAPIQKQNPKLETKEEGMKRNRETHSKTTTNAKSSEFD